MMRVMKNNRKKKNYSSFFLKVPLPLRLLRSLFTQPHRALSVTSRFPDLARMSQTDAGGSNPRSLALIHLSILVIPTQGPYLEARSKRLRTFPAQFFRGTDPDHTQREREREGEKEGERESFESASAFASASDLFAGLPVQLTMCPSGSLLPQPLHIQKCQGMHSTSSSSSEDPPSERSDPSQALVSWARRTGTSWSCAGEEKGNGGGVSRGKASLRLSPSACLTSSSGQALPSSDSDRPAPPRDLAKSASRLLLAPSPARPEPKGLPPLWRQRFRAARPRSVRRAERVAEPKREGAKTGKSFGGSRDACAQEREG